MQPPLGSFLRELRRAHRLSQDEMAQRIGVTVRTLRNCEKTEVWPSPTQLHTFCYVLQAAIEELLAV